MFRFASIIAIFSTSFCYGQNFLDVAVSVLSKEQLISKIVTNPQFTQKKILTDRYDADTLDFDVVVYTDFFNIKGRPTRIFGVVAFGRSLETDSDYQIKVYTIHDSIFLKKISRIKYIQDSGRVKTEITPVLSIIDTTRLMKFIEKHNNRYHSSGTLNDFFQKSSNYGTFGFLCGGYVPHVSEEAYSLAKLVNTNDSIALQNLASSLWGQERAFGSAGLFFLQLKGQTLSKKLLDLIAINQESKIRISCCYGCEYQDNTLAEALAMSNLESMYNFLKQDNLLQP